MAKGERKPAKAADSAPAEKPKRKTKSTRQPGAAKPRVRKAATKPPVSDNGAVASENTLAVAGSAVADTVVPSEEALRVAAYEKWLAAGKPEGQEMRFWFEAEQELKRGK